MASSASNLKITGIGERGKQNRTVCAVHANSSRNLFGNPSHVRRDAPSSFRKSNRAAKENLHERTSYYGHGSSPEKYLPHLITEEERTHFEENGYLYIPNALPTEMREQLIHTVDTSYNKALATGRAKPDSQWGWSDFLGADAALLNLVDLPRRYLKFGNFGMEFYLYHAHMHVKPPAAPDAEEGEGWLEWHKTADASTSRWRHIHVAFVPESRIFSHGCL